jgi:hypothetical protein
MTVSTHDELLRKFLDSTKPSEISAILREIGDRPDLSVGTFFGSAPFRWEFYGERDSNFSSIGLGSNAGRSLTERVTNAIDGVLEKWASLSSGALPSSPMEAAQKWFGRPPSTAINGLFSKTRDFSTNGYDRLVKVVMTAGDDDKSPTIDVVDDGIGIAPSDFPKTILSLQAGNKITKRYLAGAFGQGGASTLAFSDYVLIVSRGINSPELIGFTIIKLMRLGDPYKEDAYVYLTVQQPDGTFTVPTCNTKEPINAYHSKSHKPEPLVTGTLVRHFGYSLDGLHSTLGPSPGNLYHLLQNMMFDPLLPFRIIDLRKDGTTKDELITGSRNRLMKYTEEVDETDTESEESEESGTRLRHYAPREMVSARSDEAPTIGVEYWVPLNRRKSGDKIKQRNSSNELFVDKNNPIVGTMNGQNQGEMSSRLLRQLDLSMVAKHIVIHLDASQASTDTRRGLFSSTREKFKEGPVLNELTSIIINMLREDETLQEIERELLESVLKKQTGDAESEVKKEITKLLRDAGFEGTQTGEGLVASETGDTKTEAPTRRGVKRKVLQPPLPTLPYPEVTRFEIVYPKEKFSVHKQDNFLILIETDADFRYDRENRIEIRSEPQKLEVASKGMLQGGRLNWRLRPSNDAVPGDSGEVIATLTKPGGAQLTAKVKFEILSPREEKAKKEKRHVPNFELVPVDPYTDPETFSQAWENVKVDSVAYRAIRSSGGIIVYYNTAFRPFREQLEKLKGQNTMLSLFTDNYSIWIGYHAIIQSEQRFGGGQPLFEIADDQLDFIREDERALVAEMQVKQAFKVAELQNQALKRKSSE